MIHFKRKLSFKYERKTSILTSLSAPYCLFGGFVYFHYATTRASTINGPSSYSALSTAWASTSSAIPGRRLYDSVNNEKGVQTRPSNGLENLDLETLRVFGISDLLIGEEETTTNKPAERSNRRSKDEESDTPAVASREDIDSLLDALEREPTVKLFSDKATADGGEVSDDLLKALPEWNERLKAEEDKSEEETPYSPDAIREIEAQKEMRTVGAEVPEEAIESPSKSKQQKQGGNLQPNPKQSVGRSQLDFDGSNARASVSQKIPRSPKLARLRQFSNNVSSLGRSSKKRYKPSSTPVRPEMAPKRRATRKNAFPKTIPASVAVTSTSVFGGPLMKLIAGLAGVQLLWGLTKSFLSIFLEGWNTQTLFGENGEEETSLDDTLSDEQGSDEELDEEEIKALERLGIRPHRFVKYRRAQEGGGHDATVNHPSPAKDTRASVKDRTHNLEGRPREDEPHRATQNLAGANGPRMFVNVLGMKKKQGRTFHEMQEEIRSLRERAEMAEKDVEVLNGQLSDFMQKLEQARSQCVRLQSTNRYLKSQNDNFQTEMEDTLKRERQRATEELARIREAMVEVVDRERQLIRDHMLSVSEEVRGAILRAEEEGSTNTSGYNKEL